MARQRKARESRPVDLPGQAEPLDQRSDAARGAPVDGWDVEQHSAYHWRARTLNGCAPNARSRGGGRVVIVGVTP